MDLIPAEANASSDPTVLEMTAEAAKLAQIETTVIGATEQTGSDLVLAGKLQADERLRASQVAQVPGRIERLFVSFTGEPVRPGQRLAILHSPALISAQRELLEARRLEARRPALLQAARQKLAYWKIDSTTIAEIERSGQVREAFTLRADVGGVVTQRRVSVGDYVEQGEVLFDLVSLDRLWVRFDAYEQDLSQLSIGDEVRFQTPALPGKVFRTRISFIDPGIDPETRVAQVRGEVRNRDRKLKPGMFVRGTWQNQAQQTAKLKVPRSAVLWTGNRSVVYVQVPGASVPSYRYRAVVLGDRVGDFYLVESGLQAGDEVVTQGSFVIDAAAQLNDQASMMNQRVQVAGQGKSAPPDYRAQTPPAFQGRLRELIAHYLHLKDALVATDSVAARQAAAPILAQLAAMDAADLPAEAASFWREKAQGLRTHTEQLEQAQGVAAQRQAFQFISDLLVASVRALGNEGDILFVQYCPMAFDFEGAYWLSAEGNIRNPYFGDEMPTCGEVADTLATRVGS